MMEQNNEYSESDINNDKQREDSSTTNEDDRV